MSRDVKDLVKGILTGEIKTDSLSKEELDSVTEVMALVKAKSMDYEEQKKNRQKAIEENNKRAFREARIDVKQKQPEKPQQSEQPKEPRQVKHLTVIKEEDDMEKKGQEIVDWAPNGQWSVSKAEPPKKDAPRVLDYGKIDPAGNPMSNPKAAGEAKAKRYADIEANAGTIDYQNDMTKKPKYSSGAADRAAKVRAEIEARGKETALETMQRRGQIKNPIKKSDDLSKNEMMGYGSPAQPTMSGPGPQGSPMAMSEKEPHKDDPKHEEKEKKKAKSIKETAEEILDMHKEECYKVSDRGQWSIEKADKPHSKMTPEERAIANTPKNMPKAATTNVASKWEIDNRKERERASQRTRKENIQSWHDKNNMSERGAEFNNPKYDKEDDTGSKLRSKD